MISYDYKYCIKLAKMLADFFDLRFFDWRALFEFDNVPNTLEDVIKTAGAEYVRGKLHGICKMEAEFDDAVFACDLAVTKGIENINELIKENNYVIFLKKDDISAQINLKQKYDNSEINLFFGDSMDTINLWGDNIVKNVADIVIDIDGLSHDEAKAEIINKLKQSIS